MRRPGADGPVVKHTVKLVKVELFVNPLDHTGKRRSTTSFPASSCVMSD